APHVPWGSEPTSTSASVPMPKPSFLGLVLPANGRSLLGREAGGAVWGDIPSAAAGGRAVSLLFSRERRSKDTISAGACAGPPQSSLSSVRAPSSFVPICSSSRKRRAVPCSIRPWTSSVCAARDSPTSVVTSAATACLLGHSGGALHS